MRHVRAWPTTTVLAVLTGLCLVWPMLIPILVGFVIGLILWEVWWR